MLCLRRPTIYMLSSVCCYASHSRQLTASFDSFARTPSVTDSRSGKFGTYADRPIAAGASRIQAASGAITARASWLTPLSVFEA
jgi:hypothetical protein